MNLKELKKMIGLGEGPKVDFKLDLYHQSIQDLSKDFAAFANAEGGHILVGVEDDGNPVGVEWDAEKTAKIVQEGLSCSPPITVDVQEVHYPKISKVVAIAIPKGSWIHADKNKRFPQRMGKVTVFMDAAGLITLARGRGILPPDQSGYQAVYEPTEQKRLKPTKFEFLADYLSSKDPVARAEALKDVSKLLFNYAMEKIPGLEDKMFSLLTDDDSKVRLQALQTLHTLLPLVDSKRRKAILPRLEDKTNTMIFEDRDINVRNMALYLMSGIGSSKSIDAIIRLMKTESSQTYQAMGVTNGFRGLVNAGRVTQLRRRLNEELVATNSDETRSRITQAMDNLRNYDWSTGS